MEPNPILDADDLTASGRPGALRTGLLIAGSALFGGLAVALWHRKALTRLRQPIEAPDQPVIPTDAEDT